MPARKTIEEFDFDHQRSLKRETLFHLGALDFIHARENVVFLGPPGTGKTHLGIGIGIRACQAGHRVAFATASEWVSRLAEAHAHGRLQEELTRLGRIPLLIVDEVRYNTILPMASRDGARAAVAFDARFGDFRQAAIFPEPERRLVRPIDRERALAIAVERPLELDGDHGYLRVREDMASVLPVFVWKPCRESLSPFWPFRMVTSGAGTVYVRVDGEPFATLHDDAYGI